MLKLDNNGDATIKSIKCLNLDLFNGGWVQRFCGTNLSKFKRYISVQM